MQETVTGLAGSEFFVARQSTSDARCARWAQDASVTPTRGDHDADPIMRKIAEVRPIRPAAVLVPIVDHPEPTVLLTQRAQRLTDHAGQVSFPGGKLTRTTQTRAPRHCARQRRKSGSDMPTSIRWATSTSI